MFTSILHPKSDDSYFFNYYHAVRDNLFLNTSLENTPSFLEWIGNICLTPVRYLFAGKEIVYLDSGEITSRQTFSYKEESWVQTALMVLLLPIALLIGAIFKGFSYLSDDVRRRADLIEGYFSSQTTDIHYEENFFTEEISSEFGLIREGDLSESQEKEIEALKLVVEAFEREGLVYWMDRGSALGVYRYGDYMPYDHNIDMAILTCDHQNVKNILHRLDQSEYRVQDWSSYEKPGTFLRLYLVKTNSYITFYHYKLDPIKEEVSYDFSFQESPLPEEIKKKEEMVIPKNFLFPLKRGHFGEIRVRTPHSLEKFLELRYGDDLTPPFSWNGEKKSYEKIPDHPYFQK